MKFLATISLICLLFVSCAINYQHRAVQKARTKAIEELNMLSDADRFEVKFGQPQIFQRKIINRSENPHVSKNDFCHIWIVWKLPDTKDKYLVVSGVSEARMDDWLPQHVFLRDINDFENEKSTEDKLK